MNEQMRLCPHGTRDQWGRHRKQAHREMNVGFHTRISAMKKMIQDTVVEDVDGLRGGLDSVVKWIIFITNILTFLLLFPPVFLPGKSHGWRCLVGYSPWGHKESDITERLHFHSSLFLLL